MAAFSCGLFLCQNLKFNLNFNTPSSLNFNISTELEKWEPNVSGGFFPVFLKKNTAKVF